MVIMEKERFKNDKIVIYQEDSVLNYSILTKTKDELSELKAEISQAIEEEIQDDELKTIMAMRFIQLQDWTEIGKSLFYDRTTVYYKVKNYLRRREIK